MRRTRFLPLLAAGALLSGCAKGPDGPAMRAEVQAALDAQFGPGLFVIDSFARNGSFPFTEKGDATPRLLVYFKSRIKFAKAYSLSDWDRLNAGVLGTVLGATPDGIRGIKPDGNAAGDELAVFGTRTYVRDGGAWKPSASLAADPPAAAAPRDAEGRTKSPAERWLDELDAEYRRRANKNQRAHMAALEHEVWRARRAVHMAHDRLDGRLGVLTGGEGMSYTAIGASLLEAARLRDVPLRTYASAGSVDNVRLLLSGAADLAISQSDIAAAAAAGDPQFAAYGDGAGLRAVCSLFPEAVQVVTLAKAGISSVGELRGKRLALGPVQSGTRVNALEVLGVHGLSPGDYVVADPTSSTRALDALAAGEVDAVFTTTGYPARSIERLATRAPVRLLDLDEEAIFRLAATKPFFPRMMIPKNTYPGQDRPVRSLGVTSLLVTRADVDPAKVTGVLGLLFESHEALAAARDRPAVRPLRATPEVRRASPLFSFVTRKTARLGLSLPLHEAAAEYFGGEGP